MIIDTVGNHSLGRLRGALKAGGLVMIGGPPADWAGSLSRPAGAALAALFSNARMLSFHVDLGQRDLVQLTGLVEAGQLRSFIDRRYPLAQLPRALAYLATGHVRGKVVIEVD